MLMKNQDEEYFLAANQNPENKFFIIFPVVFQLE
jgi:hypothetical protein